MNFYTLLNKLYCPGAQPLHKLMPYALGDIMTNHPEGVDPEEVLVRANETKAILSAKAFIPPLGPVTVDGIDYPWLPGSREADGVAHLYFPTTGKPLSTQAVETDLGFVLFSLAFGSYKTVLIHAYWADGRVVHGEVSGKSRETARTLIARVLRADGGSSRHPGPACQSCGIRGDCREYSALERVGAVVSPMPPAERKSEAHRLWLNLLLLDEAGRKLTTQKKAVKDRMLQLASGGVVDVGGMLRLEVRQVEKANPKTGKVEMGEAALVKSGLDKGIDSVNLLSMGLS